MAESQPTRHLVREKGLQITLLSAKRLSIIRIALSGLKMPHSKIKVLPIRNQIPKVVQHSAFVLIILKLLAGEI